MHDIDTLLHHRGNNVIGSDGEKIGKLNEIYVDDASGEPGWALVNTGLFGTSSNFVPLDGAEPSGDDLCVAYTKDKVKDAPKIDSEEHLDASEEEELYRYYGRPMDQDTRGTDMQTGSPGHTDTESRDRDTTGRARLRKHVVTGQVETTVPVRDKDEATEERRVSDDLRKEEIVLDDEAEQTQRR